MAKKSWLDPYIYQLIKEEPFWGYISLNVTQVESTSIPSLGVGWSPKKKSYILYWNKKFLEQFETPVILGLLVHEYSHLIYKHLIRHRYTEQDKDDAKIWNFAEDLAINSLITRSSLPKDGLFAGERPNPFDREVYSFLPKSIIDELEKEHNVWADFVQSLKPRLSSEEYYDLINQNPDVKQSVKGALSKYKLVIFKCGDDPSKNQDGSGGENQTGDDGTEKALGLKLVNGNDKEVGETSDQMLQDLILKDLVEKARNNAEAQKRWGNITANLEEFLLKYKESNLINWVTLLKRFIANKVRKLDYLPTFKKMNKKFPLFLPGAKREHMLRLLFFVDQSGSVSDDDLDLIFGIIYKVITKAEIYVVNFDYNVDEKSLKKYTRNSLPTRTLCGGTSFEAPVAWLNATPKEAGKYDAVFMCTDGYAELPVSKPKVPRCWIIFPGGATSAIPKGDYTIQLPKLNY